MEEEKTGGREGQRGEGRTREEKQNRKSLQSCTPSLVKQAWLAGLGTQLTADMAHISRHLVTASGSLSVGREDDCRKPVHQRPVSGKNCGHINKMPRSVMVLYDGELPGAYFGSWGKGKRATAVWKTTDIHNLLPVTRKSRACDLREEICSEFPFLCKRMIYTHKSSFPQIPTLIPLFSKN